MQASLVTASHDVVFVVHKVMVEMDVMGPHLSVIREADLCPIVDVVSNGAVIDRVAIRGVQGVFQVEGPVD